MFESIKQKLISGWLSNLIRHGLTALGALLVAQGLPAAIVASWTEATISLAIQALPILISLLWSLLEKRALKAR